MGIQRLIVKSWRAQWIQNDVVATVTIRATQSQPTVRWGKVPLGAASCTAPSANAAIAANACTWVERGAASNGSSDIGHSPRHHGLLVRALAALKPETNRASVRDVAP